MVVYGGTCHIFVEWINQLQPPSSISIWRFCLYMFVYRRLHMHDDRNRAVTSFHSLGHIYYVFVWDGQDAPISLLFEFPLPIACKISNSIINASSLHSNPNYARTIMELVKWTVLSGQGAPEPTHLPNCSISDFLWVLKIKHRLSCFHSKHYTDWNASPAKLTTVKWYMISFSPRNSHILTELTYTCLRNIAHWLTG